MNTRPGVGDLALAPTSQHEGMMNGGIGRCQRTTNAHLRHELAKRGQTSGGFAMSDAAGSLGSMR